MEKGSMPWLSTNPVSSNAFGVGVVGWQESQAVEWEGKERKSFSWDGGGGTRGHPEMSLACPMNSWASIPSSSQCEGLRVRNGTARTARGLDISSFEAGSKDSFHSWQKRRKEGRENGRRCTLWARGYMFQSYRLICLSISLLFFLLFCFFFSLLSCHSAV